MMTVPKADARTARAKEKASSDRFFRSAFGVKTAKKKIQSGPRELLVKALGMLGSDHDGERANAARFAEKQRTQLGMTWDELIVPRTTLKLVRREGSSAVARFEHGGEYICC